MANYLKSRVVYAVMFYLLLSLLLFTAKPRVFFNDDGALKRYGLMTGETLFPMSIVCYVAAILSFYVFAVIDLVFD